MRAFRHTLTALVLSASFSGAALAADPTSDELTTQTDALVASTAQATRQALQMDIDFDVMVASHRVESDEVNAELVADVSAAPAALPVDDNNDA
ncbi:hypothetical protein [Alteromonas halophila]|uniref:Uncharacterized protein n=1 Tax=Alteromonas halophila TaxID=516698 RepID=A0A918JFN5_9ALTE|nr:hypothetical protein [Alteromonas halophila]GGW78582.1 hypothetical protein GCM10007391_09020 [Alteromonas halophila]